MGKEGLGVMVGVGHCSSTRLGLMWRRKGTCFYRLDFEGGRVELRGVENWIS